MALKLNWYWCFFKTLYCTPISGITTLDTSKAFDTSLAHRLIRSLDDFMFSAMPAIQKNGPKFAFSASKFPLFLFKNTIYCCSISLISPSGYNSSSLLYTPHAMAQKFYTTLRKYGVLQLNFRNGLGRTIVLKTKV